MTSWGIALLSVLPLAAQVRFDLVTIKPGDNGMNSWSHGDPGGRYEWHNVTLEQLVIHAYGLLPVQVGGGPDWARGKRWDVNGKVEGMRAMPTKQESRALLKSVLLERFALKVHDQPKMGGLYELVVSAGGGWKGVKAGLMQGTSEADQWKPRRPRVRAYEAATGPPAPALPPWMKGDAQPTERGRPGFYWTSQGSMEQLAFLFEFGYGSYVLDRTGLTGFFHGQLDWEPSEPIGSATMAEAMKRQWGVELVKKKGPIPHIVIDQAALPTPN